MLVRFRFIVPQGKIYGGHSRGIQNVLRPAAAHYGRIWHQVIAIQRLIRSQLWQGLAGYGLRIVVHTGEVQGSIPCASTRTVNKIKWFCNHTLPVAADDWHVHAEQSTKWRAVACKIRAVGSRDVLSFRFAPKTDEVWERFRPLVSSLISARRTANLHFESTQPISRLGWRIFTPT